MFNHEVHILHFKMFRGFGAILPILIQDSQMMLGLHASLRFQFPVES